MLKIQHVFEIKKIYVCPRRRLLSFVPAWIDLVGGINPVTHGLLNSRLKRRVEWMESSTIFAIK